LLSSPLDEPIDSGRPLGPTLASAFDDLDRAKGSQPASARAVAPSARDTVASE
jgi:hypothetical protein